MFMGDGRPALWGRTLLISRSLTLSLLPACKPLHKLCQPSREGSLDRTVGDPQPLPKPLKVIRVQRLVQRGVGWGRQRDCWGNTREQGLHETLWLAA